MTCPSASTSITVGGLFNRVDFSAPGTCNFVATFDFGGTILTATGTVTLAGTTMTTTNVVVSGGVFGPLPAPTATGPTAQDKSNIVAALQSSLNAATPGLLDGSGLPLNGAVNGNTNGVSFAPTGLAFNQSRIDPANPLDRDFGAAFSPQGYFAREDTYSANKGFNFSVDLSQMAKAANDNEVAALGAYGQGMKDGPDQPPSRLNPFVTGQYVDFDDDEPNADRDGHLWVVNGGLSFKVSDQTTVGIFSRYREGEVDSAALNASLDSDFYGGGAFLTTTLVNGVRVIGAAMYESGDNDIAIASDTGSFDSDQVTLEGRVDKRFTRGNHWIEPAVRVRYTESDQDDYTDSAGTFVLGQDLKLGRLTFGPTIGTTIQQGATAIKPFARINGVWDFQNDGNFTTSTAGVFSSGETAIKLGAGVEVAFASGMALTLAGDWFAFDTNLEVWSISGGIGAPLSVFGLGNVAPAGFVSLDFTGREDDASAKARLRIPIGKTD